MLAAAVLVAASLSACEPNRFVSGWVPYWGGAERRTAYSGTDSSTLFSEVSPFWYSAAANGSITRVGGSGDLATTVAAARAKGLPVIPSITDGTAKLVMAGILADPVKRTAHVQAIVDLVMAGHDGQGFDGIDLDYEGFAFTDGSSSWTTTRPNWVAFVNQLGAELHARGKLLTVTIPPVGGVANYWVYAQDQIAGAADRIRLMVYDYSVTSPGPIAPMTWVNQVVTYSSSVVPPSKLQLGVPAYGRYWRVQNDTKETCPDGAPLGRQSVRTSDAPALLAQNRVTATRNTGYGEMLATWTTTVTGPREAPITVPAPSTTIGSVGTAAGGSLQPAVRRRFVTCTIKHIVYYPDATSVRQRAEAALAAGWSGIVVWALGFEDAAVISELGKVARQRPNGNPLGSIDSVTRTGDSVRLVGWAADPEFDLPVPVRITTVGGATPLDRTVLARGSRTDVAAAYPGIGPFHGFDETFTLPAGTTQVCVSIRGWVGQPATSLGCRTV